MGFLNSIFGGKKENRFDSKDLSEQLREAGVSREGCKDLVESVANSDKKLVYISTATGIFDYYISAENAFKIIRPSLEKKPIVGLSMHRFISGGATLFGPNNIQAQKFVIDDCVFRKNDWDKLTSNMAQEYVKEVTFDDIRKDQESEECPFLKGLMNCRNLEALSVKDCELRDEEFSELAEKMIKVSDLKKLDLSENYARDQGLIDVINALPDSIEEFSLSSTPMGIKCAESSIIENLGNKIKTMPNLKVLDLHNCMLNVRDLESLLPNLPPSLKTLNLKDNHYMDDKALEVMIAYLKKPECALETTDITQSWTVSFSPELVQKLNEAEETNKNLALKGIQKTKAEEIARRKGEKTAEEKMNELPAEQIKSKLHQALENGIIETAFKKISSAGMVLTPTELDSKNTDGKTFVQACIDMKKTSELMQPELYNNAKVYQTLYDSLPDGDKSYFDGQGNHPSFVKMKNQVMANAVKATVAGKIKQGR